VDDRAGRFMVGTRGVNGGLDQSRAKSERGNEILRLAKTASSSFLGGYHFRIAERYLSLEGEGTPPGRQGNSNSKQGGLSAAG
jgi:hypothetical protein